MNEPRLFTKTTELSDMVCCECGIVFSMPSEFKQQKRFDGTNFYCPKGHQQHFVNQPERKRLENEIALLRSRVDQANSRLEYEIRAKLAVERSRSAIKGALTKTKTRVRNGVCPCCNRYFAKLHQHMSTQHPGYTD